MKKLLLIGWTALTVPCWAATPIAVDWGTPETAPVKVARPFAGFLTDGSFLVAGGSDFVDGVKTYRTDVAVRTPDGTWKKVGELPQPVAEGVSCAVPGGVFAAGGTDGRHGYVTACILKGDGSVVELPDLPSSVTMGAAAADGATVYVVGAQKVWKLDTANGTAWTEVGTVPGPARAQHVATIQNGDQKEKRLVIYGGFDVATRQPLHDGSALVLSSGEWKTLAPLPENTTTIGAAFLPSGHQHVA